MPRNSTGNYSLASASFIPQASIVATDVNADLNDIANAITQSLATTGVSNMTGPLILASGLVTAPSLVFSGSVTTGFYLSAANEISLAVSSIQSFKFNSSGITAVGTKNITDKNGTIIYGLPLGAIFPYAGATAPSLWVLCGGQAVSRNTYANLFALIGTTYGIGDGTTTFNVPDLRGRLPFGLDNMNGSAANRITVGGSGIAGTTIGATGGTQNLTIAQANLPNNSMTVTDPTHTHTTGGANAIVGGGTLGFGAPNDGSGTFSVSSNATGITVTLGGSGTALASLNPALIMNYILFAGV